MAKQLTSEQREKIVAVKRYIEIAEDSNCLHAIVTILGVCFFGAIIGRKPQTVWLRIINPYQFRYHEMKSLSKMFDITVTQLLDIIEKQSKYNELLACKGTQRRLPMLAKYNKILNQ